MKNREQSALQGLHETMIKSFSHKGLETFFNNGSLAGVQPAHAKRLARILDRLDASTSPKDMDLPGFRLHPLSGKFVDKWAVCVSGNWRVIFQFSGQDAFLVDYLDYH